MRVGEQARDRCHAASRAGSSCGEPGAWTLDGGGDLGVHVRRPNVHTLRFRAVHDGEVDGGAVAGGTSGCSRQAVTRGTYLLVVHTGDPGP